MGGRTVVSVVEPPPIIVKLPVGLDLAGLTCLQKWALALMISALPILFLAL